MELSRKLWYRAIIIKDDQCLLSADRVYCCWFAKVLRFFRIKNNSSHKRQRHANENDYCEGRTNKPYQALCFVQWYEVLNEEVLSIDNIDKSLSCTGPMWEIRLKKPHALSASEAFGHISLERTRSAVRVVPKETIFIRIDKKNCRKVYAMKLASSGFGWKA